jgi:hypothetical protein
MSAQIIEKDYWVCWSLKRLFSLDDFRGHLTFKGGTSLSKVYGAIERFSEDVDVAIERGYLGFGGDNEPEKGTSGKEQQRRIAQLSQACKAAISKRLGPQLQDAISDSLPPDALWKLMRDPQDPDQQTLLFRYPPAISAQLSPYFAPSVKIELGARSDHFPVDDASIRPYISDAFPDALNRPSVHLRVLAAERTFWEKATILHMLHHFPLEKKVAPRMSRHYYDVFQLSNSDVLDRAMDAIELLTRVAIHKRVFFKSGWANYESARPGTLRLVPGDRIIAQLRRDYDAMEPMFFGAAPEFEEILRHLPELEHRINATKA